MADEITIEAVPAPTTAIVVSSAAATPMEMLSRALESGKDITILEKLMDLQERWEKNEGRKAFDAAVADAKAEIPVIIKNRQGHNSKYADLGAFAAAVNPVLAKYGLSYRYRSAQEGAAIRVTCVLSHRDGHSEETELSDKADTSDNKNGIQALASTLTYLQRYTLKLALGLADSEGDDDGRAAGGDEAITEDQRNTILGLIEQSGSDIKKFCDAMKVEAVPDIRQSQYPVAIAKLETKLKAKKRETAQ